MQLQESLALGLLGVVGRAHVVFELLLIYASVFSLSFSVFCTELLGEDRYRSQDRTLTQRHSVSVCY